MDQSYSARLLLILLILDQGISINNLLLGHPQLATSNIQAMIIPAENFYNPLDSDLCKDDYRFPNKPISSTALNTYRFLQGIRGSYENGWDYEAAFVWSKAYSRNVVENRIGMDLLEVA